MSPELSGALERWVVLFRRPLHGALDTPGMNQGPFPSCSSFNFTGVVAEIFANRIVDKRAVLSAQSTTSKLRTHLVHYAGYSS